ncbi:MAG TPA: hypothetical protein EYQ29_06655 [Candidatus Lambdaproteobacteria bacterium]|nr:hypothetical protein [Candidatus Lambdaproteobacteria bacterium]
MTEHTPRVLVVCFDALRPDMATPELMPNLTSFAQRGVRCAHQRSVFPTETRVNQASLVTGCHPERHGIVGNKFLDPVASPGRLFNTGDETQLVEGDRRLGGKLVDVPVLGELLAKQGMTLATLSSGTPGGARMLNHKAESLGGFRFALHRPDASVPKAQIEAVIKQLGPIPDPTIPSLDWLTYATNTYLQHIEPEWMPEVCILWFCEPDNSYHYCGLGSEQNLSALRHADAQFGRILQWRESSAVGEHLQIITMSDHGQLTIADEAVGLAAGLQTAGFTVGETVGDGVDAALVLDSAGGIYVRDSDPDLIKSIVQWLQQQSWCGPVFTRGGTDSLTHAQVKLDHSRAPDIGLALRSDDAPNEHGIPGTCRHDSTSYPAGGGLHGGLHPYELSSWLAASGNAFRSQHFSETPTGIIDLLPTILQILGIEIPKHVQGRVLYEVLQDNTGHSTPEVTQTTFSTEGVSGYSAQLSLSCVGSACYLERGWVS